MLEVDPNYRENLQERINKYNGKKGVGLKEYGNGIELTLEIPESGLKKAHLILAQTGYTAVIESAYCNQNFDPRSVFAQLSGYIRSEWENGHQKDFEAENISVEVSRNEKELIVRSYLLFSQN